MVATGNSSHKPMPSTLCMGCFSYISVLKWCIHGTTPTTHSCWNIAHRYSSHKSIPIILSMEYSLLSVGPLTQAGPTGTSPNKPMPNIFSTGCFSYTSRVKSCLPGSPPINLCPVLFSKGCVSLACSGWNGAYANLPQTYSHAAL